MGDDRLFGNSKFLSDLGQLSLNLGASLDFHGVFHDQINPFLHSTGVSSESWSLDSIFLTKNQSIDRHSGGNETFRASHPGDFLDSNHFQFSNGGLSMRKDGNSSNSDPC